eukprot:scpid45442/ scgid26905/ 
MSMLCLWTSSGLCVLASNSQDICYSVCVCVCTMTYDSARITVDVLERNTLDSLHDMYSSDSNAPGRVLQCTCVLHCAMCVCISMILFAFLVCILVVLYLSLTLFERVCSSFFWPDFCILAAPFSRQAAVMR